eukprot:TRINITY_DN7947_c0_g1_i1.p1 TRINITY_DN7947_c0_g1~~TRINITY_DN7947_c0_g1_i1.p1  ORF type:complete len:106 (-),score=15.78 TRINITY_DN7947_c0_g1_i1:5-322(-)
MGGIWARSRRKNNGVSNDGGSDLVGIPYNIKNTIHVDFNSDSGFVGLPPEWQQILKDGGISRKSVLLDPKAVLDVLEFAQICMDSNVHEMPLPHEKTIKRSNSLN